MRCSPQASARQRDLTRCTGYGQAAKAKRPDPSPPRNAGPLLDATGKVGRCAAAYMDAPARAQDTPLRYRNPGGGELLMGAGLAAEAAVKFGDVGYDAYRVLVWMALQALDTEGDRGQPPRLFFGGRDTLVERIRPGLPPKTDSTPDARRKRHNAYRDLQAAQETLVACGALVRVGGIARDGNKQTWRLALNRRAGRSERQERKRLREAARRARLKAEREAVDNGLEGGALSRAQGGALSRTEDGALSPSRVGHCPTPIRTEEPLEERLEEPEDNRSRSNGSPREEPEDDGNWPGHFADEPDPFRLRVVK